MNKNEQNLSNMQHKKKAVVDYEERRDIQIEFHKALAVPTYGSKSL
jgi:hypothetical protein